MQRRGDGGRIACHDMVTARAADGAEALGGGGEVGLLSAACVQLEDVGHILEEERGWTSVLHEPHDLEEEQVHLQPALLARLGEGLRVQNRSG